MKAAFKEWAIVVDALGRGRQSLILRKGGIREGKGGFSVDYDSFLLFPTGFHQQGASVIGDEQATAARVMGTLSADTIQFTHWATLDSWLEVVSLEQAEKLQSLHIWSPDVIRSRFDWGRNQGIFALILRVYQLPEPVQIAMLESYGGCKSWIEVAQDISVDGSKAVLSDAAFSKERQAIESALNG